MLTLWVIVTYVYAYSYMLVVKGYTATAKHMLYSYVHMVPYKAGYIYSQLTASCMYSLEMIIEIAI